ncbi:sensor histidine kinase [Arsenicicoccus bolidensis]|uniref:Sensor histidine kinase n=1 Tax=Arsenicicoccus bolidensis TaxID=229480 RepID=A0ABS9PYQ7_9MICO|nr:sensor histidine kinase [Arsenicicoccus bolidensis]MCG7320768.1 sensor histidine kinase [Arsenicicoccus bolidensis]
MSGAHSTLQNPWSRYGWVMAAVWLAFLGFPVIEVLQDSAPTWLKGIALAAIACFAFVYVWSMNRLWAFGEGRRVNPAAVRWYALLIALCLVTVPVLGVEVVGMAPFLLSFAMFTFPLRHAFGISAALLALAVGLPWWAGAFGSFGFLTIILVIVFISTAVTRVANNKEFDYTRTKDALRIASERERVARDVHDVLGHSLTVVAVKTELAERLLDVDVERARAELIEIRSLTRTALAEIRETVGGLRVASLGDEVEGARMALTGAGIAADLPGDLTVVDPRHRTVLAWVLREAVTNVVRHSGAGRCAIRLSAAGLVVEDDGRGLRGAKEGNGIRGLRERVAGAGGSLTIGPGPDGRGTRLEVRL